MVIYEPSKTLAKFIKTIENGGVDTIKTFIITGKNGPTGKMYLTNWLQKKMWKFLLGVKVEDYCEED